MKFVIDRNYRDSDGSQFIYFVPETQAESAQVDFLLHSLNRFDIKAEELDLPQMGVKQLKLRVLHMEAGRENGPPLKIDANLLRNESSKS